MKVDLALGSPEPASVAGLARAAESFGFDAVWLAETRHDPFVSAALALAATGTIEVGTGIAVAFARSPIVLAQSAFDLAALSGGRFHLGLGTQVRAHVERWFGMPWSAPAPRLAVWIAAVRAAWATWQDGTPFRVRSVHLNLSLMSEFFSPPPLSFGRPDGSPRVPLSVAGVGPGLARLAGRVADGFQVHPFHTARYLSEVLEPALERGEAERPGGHPRRVARIVPVFVAPTDVPAAVGEVRSRIAFYASTPTYRPVLALHGRAHVGERLGRLAVAGRWDEMADLVDDELLALVAVVAPSASIAAARVSRVAGHADRVLPVLPFEPDAFGAPTNASLWGALMESLRAA